MVNRESQDGGGKLRCDTVAFLTATAGQIGKRKRENNNKPATEPEYNKEILIGTFPFSKDKLKQDTQRGLCHVSNGRRQSPFSFLYFFFLHGMIVRMHTCPLCRAEQSAFFYRDARRSYFRCHRCALVFVEPGALLAPAAEQAVYAQHQNHPDDPGYRRFLSRLAEPLAAKLASPQSGLDFGCGPGPTLSLLLEQKGHRMALYDPYFAPHPQVLTQRYDFITCTEAIEHFYQPAREWALWLQLLKPGGWLAIMTKRVLDPARFAQWHYKNDPTHVSFFATETFAYLAERDQLALEVVGDDVVLLQSRPDCA